MQSIAGGLLNSPSVSLKLYASAPSVFPEFAFLAGMYVCIFTKGKAAFGSAGHVYGGQEKTKKRPFPVTDRPDTTEIGCCYSVGGNGGEVSRRYVLIHKGEIPDRTSPGGTRDEICLESASHFFPRVSPLPIFLSVFAEIRRDGVGFP